MSDIFLSYKREDFSRAEEIVQALRLEGYDVFFNPEIRIGESWDTRLEQEITVAKAVVVLWSTKSRNSDFVRSEARAGQARGILVPVFIETCAVPLGLDLIQAADLRDWTRHDRDHSQWKRLISALSGLNVSAKTPPAKRRRSRATRKTALELQQPELPFSPASDRRLGETAWTAFWRNCNDTFTPMGKEEFVFYRQNAERGEPWAQVMLGIMFLLGRGVEASESEALKYFKAAASKGWTQAHFALGVLYESGIGHRMNFKKAAAAYARAAKKGHAPAEYNLRLLADRNPRSVAT